MCCLKYLDGGHGEGCHNEDDAYTSQAPPLPSPDLLRLHALCFAATSVATLYHYLLGWEAPYDLPSLPCCWCSRRREPDAGTAGSGTRTDLAIRMHGDAKQNPWTWLHRAVVPGRQQRLGAVAGTQHPLHWPCCCACTWVQ